MLHIFKPGDKAVRVDSALKGVPIGSIIEILSGPIEERRNGALVYLTRVVGEQRQRNMYACFLRPVEALSMALARDGITGEKNLSMVRELTVRDFLAQHSKPTPSVKVQLRREGRPDRKTVHPVPAGWKYGLREPLAGEETSFDLIVITRRPGFPLS